MYADGTEKSGDVAVSVEVEPNNYRAWNLFLERWRQYRKTYLTCSFYLRYVILVRSALPRNGLPSFTT